MSIIFIPFVFSLLIFIMVLLFYRSIIIFRQFELPKSIQTQLTYSSLIPLHSEGKFSPATFKAFDPPLTLFPFKNETYAGFERFFSFSYAQKYAFKGDWRKQEVWFTEFATSTWNPPRFALAIRNSHLPHLFIRPRQATDLLKEIAGDQFIDNPALNTYDLALFIYEKDKFSAQWVKQFPATVWNILTPGRSVVICDGQWFLFYNRPEGTEDNVLTPENFLYQALGFYNALTNPLENL